MRQFQFETLCLLDEMINASFGCSFIERDSQSPQFIVYLLHFIYTYKVDDLLNEWKKRYIFV